MWGSFAAYLEPWHPDILGFLDLKRPTGESKNKAMNLHYALWVPDLFMEYVKEDKLWYLFGPK